MLSKKSRIYFEGNPYPKGHLIKDFQWSARLDSKVGIWFDFHLETEKYFQEDHSDDPVDFEPEDDWNSKIVWKNYNNCTMSSTEWHAGGFLVGTEKNKINFNDLDNKSYEIDTLPRPDDFDYDEDPFCCIYLLGHDDCADHKIHFTKKESGLYDISWEGKIALSYIGDYEFNHNFKAFIEDVKFENIYYDEDLNETQLKECLHKFSIGFDALKLIKEV